MDLDTLKEEVSKLLILDHDFGIEEAEEAVRDSIADHPNFWSENADPKDLANLLASDDNDD